MCDNDLVNRLNGLSQTLESWLAHLEMNYSHLVNNPDVVNAIPPYQDLWKIQGNLVDSIKNLRYAVWKLSRSNDDNNTWYDKAYVTHESSRASKETVSS